MKVKDFENIYSVKIIHPETGKIGYFKGEFSGGIFMGINKTNDRDTVAVPCNEDDYLNWDVYEGEEKCDINTLFKRK